MLSSERSFKNDKEVRGCLNGPGTYYSQKRLDSPRSDEVIELALLRQFAASMGELDGASGGLGGIFGRKKK